MRVFIKLLLAITIASALGLYLLFSALRTPIRMPLKGDPDHYSERVSLRETSILNGCIENFGKGACQGRMSLLLNGKIRRNPSEFLADGVGPNIPNPRWNSIAGNFRFWGAEHCGPEQISLFLNWFNKSKPEDGLISVSLLPDNLGLCFGRETQNGEMQYRYFWFFQGDRFIAWMRCTRIGSVPNPSCNLNASPTEGTSWAQLGFYPAINAGRIAEQMPSIFRKLQFNLPQSRPDLRLLLQQTYLETRVVFSDAAMAQLLKFEEDLR